MTSPSSRLLVYVYRWVCLIPALLCGCMGNTAHLAFTTISAEGWADTDTLHYTLVPPPEIRSSYEPKNTECGVSILLHTEGYTYENIAFHITIEQDSMLYTKQHACALSEGDPVRGIGWCYDYSFPIGNIVYNDTLPLTIALRHCMESSPLQGIRSIGVRIGERHREPGEVVWQVQW